MPVKMKMPMSMHMHEDECGSLLREIQEMQFVAIELQLYLDTHPCDRDALNDYNCAIQVLRKLMDEWEERYGSLMALGFHGEQEWNWPNSPWPWER